MLQCPSEIVQGTVASVRNTIVASKSLLHICSGAGPVRMERQLRLHSSSLALVQAPSLSSPQGLLGNQMPHLILGHLIWGTEEEDDEGTRRIGILFAR